MEEQEKPNPWEEFLDTGLPPNLSEVLDELGGKNQSDQTKTESSAPGIVTIEFYQTNTTLYSYAYEKRLSVQAQLYMPNKVTHSRVGSGDIYNVIDLGRFVKEYTGQLEHIGFQPESPQKIEIGDGNNSGLLFIHQYDFRSEIGSAAGLRIGEELTGIIRYLQQRYNKS